MIGRINFDRINFEQQLHLYKEKFEMAKIKLEKDLADHHITNGFNQPSGALSDSSDSTTPVSQTMSSQTTFDAVSTVPSDKKNHKLGILLILAIPFICIFINYMVSDQHVNNSVPCTSTVLTTTTLPSTVIVTSTSTIFVTVNTVVTSTSTYTSTSTSTSHKKHNHKGTKQSSTSSSVPWPGSTFHIRASSSGKLLSLDSGYVILAQPGDNPGRSIHWKCIEYKGWLHFQNAVSGCYLGYDWNNNVVCFATKPQEWERFSARLRPEGGYYLMVTHWERLWKLGISGGYLAKIGGGEFGTVPKTGEKEGEVIVWEFVKA
ncbi:hypothetical protein SBOR_1697 [Sclerotinia borealis F-4128]|uniref:Ricin B lectin domain-containing protein n=1 Tax=Sclerotinia borealis (strain F-4128) TaxID=1432307 RepID=W9CMC1_SCLBF|nr:hypothetical protein SBOR_1697 [Sclerotinia borealis F-4128]